MVRARRWKRREVLWGDLEPGDVVADRDILRVALRVERRGTRHEPEATVTWLVLEASQECVERGEIGVQTWCYDALAEVPWTVERR